MSRYGRTSQSTSGKPNAGAAHHKSGGGGTSGDKPGKSGGSPKLGTTPPSIGPNGNTMGEISTEGGQLPFMPSASSYSGRMEQKQTPGQSSGSNTLKNPVLPEKASGL